MNIAIAGLKQAELASYLRKYFPQFNIVKKNPEMILCYGGDGTLLFAERSYPGVPKVMIRNSRVCHQCARLSRDTILKLLVTGQYFLAKHALLEAKVKQKKLYGLNDIIVGHAMINTGLRFTVYLNGEQYGDEYLGDGVIVATPLGSTGYYQSVTHSTFQSGLGVAFNNIVNNLGHLVIKNNVQIKVKINREPAIVMADNDKTMLSLNTGQTVIIQQSARTTTIVYFKGKQYRQFNIGIGEDRVPLGYCQVCSKRLPS